MKLKEIFARHGVEADEKARRVLNTSSAKANITASEIEDGVSIERLGEIGVPCLRYATQVTIHGVLPGFSSDVRPAGFKSVFANKNGTMGVRYVAIDAAKKERLVEVSRLSENRVWGARLSSTGLSIWRSFEKREDCVASYETFPRDLYCGSVIAGAGALGGYYIFAEVGAIPADNFWKLADALWQIGSAQHFESLKSARDEKYAADKLAGEKRQAEQAAKVAALRVETAATVGSSRLEKVKFTPGSFLRVTEGRISSPRLMRYTLKKRGPRLCFQSSELSGDASARQWHPVTPAFESLIQKDCSAGFVFADQAA